MERYSLDEFLASTAEQDHGQGVFEHESARMLEVNLDGTIWTKMGSMVAYTGNIKFTREGILEHGRRQDVETCGLGGGGVADDGRRPGPAVTGRHGQESHDHQTSG
jgi:hypothetical protein